MKNKNITILVKHKLVSYLKLFHILINIHFYFDNINIIISEKYYNIVHTIFDKIQNIILISNSDNYIEYEDNQDFLNKLCLYEYKLLNNDNSMINRDFYNENLTYEKFRKFINFKYIFYFNDKDTKIIKYFENLYIYNPLKNFYEVDNNEFNYWNPLNVNNMTFYLKIIENSEELHIFNIDMLYLILEIDTSYIKNKYLYFNDILIKENDNRLIDWNIIKYE